jgi:hypothetical protein
MPPSDRTVQRRSALGRFLTENTLRFVQRLLAGAQVADAIGFAGSPEGLIERGYSFVR